MGKGFWVALVAVLAVMIGAFIVLDDSEPVEELDNPHEIVANVDHTIGSIDAPVTLVKYSDFQCPACQSSAVVLEEVRSQYSEDELLFVYRHSPFLPQAFDAARASEAASEQGDFWGMHDLLFARLDDWSGSTNARSVFEGFAEELGLDVEQFSNDFAGTSSRVERDVAIRTQLGVQATPTYSINGEMLEQNPGSVEAFYELIDNALAAAEEEDEPTEANEDAVREDEEETGESQ